MRQKLIELKREIDKPTIIREASISLSQQLTEKLDSKSAIL